MKDKKILVTGGAGFIGSHLIDKLIETKNKITVIDNLISSTEEYLKPHIQSGDCIFIKEDIRDRNLIDSIKDPIDYIFHLAADPDVKNSVDKPIVSFENNVDGTVNILELSRRLKIKGLIFASSGGTLYGDVEKFPIVESDILSPISPYGASKAACEMYISAYANSYKFKAVSARYANIFGERSTHGVCYDFYYKLLENPSELLILGNGDQQKSYLHVSDCIEATILLGDNLLNQKKWFDYYNLGSKEWVTVKKIAKLIENEMGLEKVNYKFTGGKKGWIGDVHNMLLSIEKIGLLGWEPNYTFKESLHKYIEWLKKKSLY